MTTEEKIFKEFKEKFDTLVKNHKGRIVISSHINPDDDSITSVLSVYTYLKDILKIENTVEIYYTNNPVDRWKSIKYFEKVQFANDVNEILNKEDLLILLDCQGYYRISNQPEEIIIKNIPTIVIDHHKTNADREYTLMLSYPTIFKSSNAEIMYELFFKEKKEIEKETAEILLIGLYSDTGGFRFINKETSSALLTAKEILDKSDVKIDYLLGRLEGYTTEQIKILSLLLANVEMHEIEKWGKFSITYVTREEVKQFSKEQISSGKAIYGFYQKTIGGSNWGILIYPDMSVTTDWIVSFRSQPGSPNVRLICQGLDPLGGGHDAAAACKIKDEVLGTKLTERRVLEKVLDYLKNNSPTIIPT